MRPRDSEAGSTQLDLRMDRLHSFIGLARWMVVLCWSSPSGICDLCYGHGHQVSAVGLPFLQSLSSYTLLSMCEEVKQPSTQVPKALVGTIFLNTIAGIAFLVPLVYVLPDIAELLADPSGQPVPAIISAAVGNKAGAFVLTIPLIVLGIICGVGCTTAASRCTWAFSRDGAIPGSHLWSQVHPGLGLPLNAMMLSMVVQIALGCVYFGSSAAFNAFSGVGVIFLTVSYAIPIVASMIGRRKQLKDAPFNMGTFGLVCNIVAVGTSYPVLLWTLCLANN